MNDKRKKRRYVGIGLLLPLMLLLGVSSIVAQMANQDYRMFSSVLISGGGRVSSVDYTLQSSLAQPTPIGLCESQDFSLYAGFQSTTVAEFLQPAARRGDVDGDWTIDVVDVVHAANHIIGIIPLTGDSLRRADCNDDGHVDVLDAQGIVNVILELGECEPGACRTELTAEALEFLKALEPYFTAENFAKFMTLVKPEVQVPTEYSLAQNYPNPFNPTTTIQFTLPHGGRSTETGDRIMPVHTTLKIYNILGQEVRTLVDGVKEPGYFTVTWDGKDSDDRQAASGVYFYRLAAGSFTATRRMVLMK